MTIEQVQTIPVRKGWPLLGVLPEIIGQASRDYFKKVMLEQGDLVRLNVGPSPCIWSATPIIFSGFGGTITKTTASRICFMLPREKSLVRDWSPAPASYGCGNDG